MLINDEKQNDKAIMFTYFCIIIFAKLKNL